MDGWNNFQWWIGLDYLIAVPDVVEVSMKMSQSKTLNEKKALFSASKMSIFPTGFLSFTHRQWKPSQCNVFHFIVSNSGICKHQHLSWLIIKRLCCWRCTAIFQISHLCRSILVIILCVGCRQSQSDSYSQVWIFILLMIDLFIFLENSHAVLWNVFNCWCHE